MKRKNVFIIAVMMLIFILVGCGEEKSGNSKDNKKAEMSESEMQQNDVDMLNLVYSSFCAIIVSQQNEVTTDMQMLLYLDKAPELIGFSENMESELVEIMGDLKNYRLMYEDYDGYGVKYSADEGIVYYVKPDGSKFEIVDDRIFD